MNKKPESKELLGYVQYDPDSEGEADEDAITLCRDCGEVYEKPDGFAWAVITDGDAYGGLVPYPECHLCGEVMRPEDG